VRGYLFQADKAKDRSPALATHAWVEAYLGEAGWVALDPTNNPLGSERHIHVAVGRDYADVPPARGVYKGEAECELSVRVVVAPVEGPRPEELPPAMLLRTKRPEPKTAGSVDQQQQQ
jgi:transglutaminase-like putative cysteine protease